MTGRRGLLWLLAGLALALLGGRWLAGRYGDWAFLHALGADAVWRESVLTASGMRLAVFAVTFAFSFANLFAVRQSIVSLVLPRVVGNLQIGEAIPTRRLTVLAFGGALLLAALFALIDQDWTVTRLALGGLPFREMEPYLERDLGFFVSWLPFEQLWNGIVVVLVVLTTAMVIALYASTPSVRWDEKGLYVSTWVRRHLGILGGIAILLLAWDWRLDRFSLLTDGGSATSILEAPRAFSAYDHRILLPYLTVLSFIAMPTALIFAWTVWRGHLRLAFGLLTALVIGGPLARLALPALGGRGGTDPASVARERPYVATRTLYSRRAFGVDAIAHGDTQPSPMIALGALAGRVSSWDPAALTRAIERERRGTNVVAFAWQGTPMGLQAVLLRAAPTESPPGSAWPLDRVQASGTDARGAPTDVPGLGERGIGGILVEPGASRYVIVADTTGRLAAPAFATVFERLAHSWDQQNPRLLAADVPSPRPRILVHRDVRERLGRLVPFLEIGPSLTPLVHGDSLYWVAELFAVATEYPLAERIDFQGRSVHYVAHAATALVQAQTGQVVLYAVAAPDPVTRSWMRIFPSLFRSRSAAPVWLRTALPPAADWAEVQGRVLGRTGFFGDTLSSLDLARVDDADADLSPGPPTLFQLDTAGTTAWGVPVVDGADRISGLLVATGGTAPHTTFRSITTELRWTTILERMQAAADSAGFGRALPYARRGRVQAVPVTGGAAFVQCFYEWPPDGPPRLAGVVILEADRIRVGRSLAAALGLPEESTPRSLPAELFRARAAALYDAMSAALRSADWRAYGDAWAALGRLLGRPRP